MFAVMQQLLCGRGVGAVHCQYQFPTYVVCGFPQNISSISDLHNTWKGNFPCSLAFASFCPVPQLRVRGRALIVAFGLWYHTSRSETGWFIDVGRRVLGSWIFSAHEKGGVQ